MSKKELVQNQRLPEWIRIKINKGKDRSYINGILKERGLNTVCEEAKCPNLAECWHRKTATFMLLGKNCTRACRFCAIGYNTPEPIDEDEPKKVAKSAKLMNLDYVVITSVARDDLEDEGANQFYQTITEVRTLLPNSGIEVLTPDFNGRIDCLKKVLSAKPTVFNHNLETCERLSPAIRGKAKYQRSLLVLENIKKLADYQVLTKSGIMLGMGENDDEVKKCLQDLYNVGVDILTIGQYLAPSSKHWKVVKYITKEKFIEWERYAKELGFSAVASSPMVRSSYKAGDLVKERLSQI